MAVRYADPGDVELSEEEYRRFALGDRQGRWELHNGRLREKPPMSVEHGDLMSYLDHLLQAQLDRREFRVRVSHARLRGSAGNYYVPDLVVLPTALDRALRARPGSLDAYPEALPLVVEIWSPSTGDYDVDAKIPEYMARGDLEIWRLHPYQRTLTAWRRQPDGSYEQTVATGGIVRPASLPGVAIDLDTLFDD